MKHKLQIISALAASILARSALAEDQTNTTTAAPDYSRDRMSHTQRTDRLNDSAKASDLIGMTVRNYQNEKLGKVHDLAVDVESGRVVQVILSTGGFIGIGDTQTAVPPSAFHHDVANKVLHLDADKDKVLNAPKFEMSQWADYSDSNHLAQVYSYYGQEPSLGFIQTGDMAQDGRLSGYAATNSLRRADGTWDKDRLSSDGQRLAGNATDTNSLRRADGTWDNDRVSRYGHSQWMIPASRLGQIQKASKLIGTSVNNLQDEKLGKVENLLVDLPSGRILAVIVSSGGFLGIGNELSAIPPTALRFTADRDILQLDASKEMLASAPHFKSDQWPDFAQPAYSSEMYRAYKVEPYFGIDSGTQPDNTVRNVRDRDNSTLTPLDQGNNKADMDVTAQIRKQIIASKDMSMSARNVKIITVNGRVSLRGPVKTDEEKRRIGEIAERVAHSENVDNQLEVKSTPPKTD